MEFSDGIDADALARTFARRLPVRALKHVVEVDKFSTRDALNGQFFINDFTLYNFLEENDVDVVQVVRKAIDEVLQKTSSHDGDDIFWLLDEKFRTEDNPLLPAVRSFLKTLFSKKNEKCQ
jgi:hypothetical protein